MASETVLALEGAGGGGSEKESVMGSVGANVGGPLGALAAVPCKGHYGVPPDPKKGVLGGFGKTGRLHTS